MFSLADLAQRAVKAALDEDIDQADAFVQRAKRISVEIEKNAVKLSTITYDYGLSIRAFKRGGMGFANSQLLKEEAAASIGRRAAKLAKSVHPDPDFVTLPEARRVNVPISSSSSLTTRRRTT